MNHQPTMRIVTQNELGGPDVLTLAEAPVPTPGPSQVLVKVAATSLNPTDWIHRRVAGFLGDRPKVLGWDVSGTVEAVGTGVTIHRPGDRVFGMLPYPHGHGAAAEYVLAPARALVAVPQGVDHPEAAAVPLVALTAWQALVDTAGIQAGDRVLIHAAAGGVGHVAVQIARALGAHVIGTASARNHAMVERLGAHEMIDYTATAFEDVVRDVDVVLDTIGRDVVERSLGVVRRGGTIVSLALGSTVPLGRAAEDAGVAHRLMLVEHDQHGMRRIAELMAAGELTPVIDREAHLFDLEAVRSAHAHGETGRTAGKIVLRADR